MLLCTLSNGDKACYPFISNLLKSHAITMKYQFHAGEGNS